METYTRSSLRLTILPTKKEISVQATVNITVTDVNEAPTVDDSEPAGVSTVFENHNNTLEDIEA